MAGHSKWANIKHKKGSVDAKRGKLFTKLIKEVQVAARLGGGDPKSNPRLRDAIAEAKSHNMPKDNIDRAIKRGTGEIEGAQYEQITYEGYGPGGAAILIESLTDNRNRTVAEIRATMGKNHGNLGEAGSVAWMFDQKGLLLVEKGPYSEEKIMELALEVGAEDVQDGEDVWEVYTAPSDFATVKDGLEEKAIKVVSASLAAIPQTTVHLAGEDAEKMLKLMELLEDLDDVQKLHANFDIDQEELERLSV